jgi:hypothetical protein
MVDYDFEIHLIFYMMFYLELLLSAKHRSTMPNLFITSGWAYVFHMTSPLILVLYHSEVLQKPVQA